MAVGNIAYGLAYLMIDGGSGGAEKMENYQKNSLMLSKRQKWMTSVGKLFFWAQKIRKNPEKFPKIAKKITCCLVSIQIK
jgi:hypothetical protein